MKIGNTVFIWFRVPSMPKVRYKPRASFLKRKLEAQFGKIEYVEFTDNYYNCFGRDELDRLLQYNFFRHQKYIPEEHDCEEFAYSLLGFLRGIIPGIPFGIVHVDVEGDGANGKHALNIFYDYATKKFWFCEPQSNKVFLAKNYKPYMVIM